MISVIVPVYNGATTISSCLEPLARQELVPDDYEVLVVDNRSTDSTFRQASGFGGPIKVIQETETRGSYAARNAGIRASRGDILAFTDADCVPDASWLARIAEGFRDPKIGCVVGEVYGYPPATPAERFAVSISLLSQRGTLQHHYRPYAQTANVAYRREVFDHCGLFEPSLVSGGDADLCWRMQAAGRWQMTFVESAFVLHHHRVNSRELWKQFNRYGRGAAALEKLYPDLRLYDPNEFRCCVGLWRRTGRHMVASSISSLRAGSTPTCDDGVLFSWYSALTATSYLLGKFRGPARPVQPMWSRTG